MSQGSRSAPPAGVSLSLHAHAAVRLLDHADVIATIACGVYRPDRKVSKDGEARNRTALFPVTFQTRPLLPPVAGYVSVLFCSLSLSNSLRNQLLLQAEEQRVRGTGQLVEGPG